MPSNVTRPVIVMPGCRVSARSVTFWPPTVTSVDAQSTCCGCPGPPRPPGRPCPPRPPAGAPPRARIGGRRERPRAPSRDIVPASRSVNENLPSRSTRAMFVLTPGICGTPALIRRHEREPRFLDGIAVRPLNPSFDLRGRHELQLEVDARALFADAERHGRGARRRRRARVVDRRVGDGLFLFGLLQLLLQLRSPDRSAAGRGRP